MTRRKPTSSMAPKRIAAIACAAVLALAVAPATAIADVTAGSAELSTQATTSASSSVVMHRMYNPNSGEHFYTSSDQERDGLVKLGWRYEGLAWNAPKSSKSPVYRMYNPNSGDHHYTLSASERDNLRSIGWNYEGVGWYSDDAKGVPLYRQFNPNAIVGTHNYTYSKAENDNLVKLGWRAEGVGWYGVDTGGAGSAKKWVKERGHYETVTVKAAWDEPVYERHAVCVKCGLDLTASGMGNMRHADQCGGHTYDTQVQVGTKHHDAVTERRWVVDVPGHWE